MSISRTIQYSLGIFSFFLFFYALPEIQRRSPSLVKTIEIKEKSNIHLTLDSSLLKIASIGQQRAVSAILWITTLMYSDFDHHKDPDRFSWMYYNFENIANLDPYFYSNYLDGGLYLSVIKDDVLGSERIFDRGLLIYPNDYWLNFYSGFNKYFELNDSKGSLLKFNQILYHPITYRRFQFLPSLIFRIQGETGDLDIAIDALKFLIASEIEEARKKRYQKMLYAALAEVDLNCLNDNRTSRESCHHRDAEGAPYVKINGTWQAQKPWKPLRTRQLDKKKGHNVVPPGP